MKIETQGAQGDLLVRRSRVDVAGLVERLREGGRHIVAHSETGHHHAIDDKMGQIHRYATANPLVDLLVVDDGCEADVVHHRDWDTHPTITLGGGTWEIRRQREHTPEGWRLVVD